MSFTKFLNFIGLCLVAIVFLVIGSVHVVWSPPGEPPGLALMMRLQLPIGRNEDGDSDPQTKASFGRWLQQVAVAAYGEKSSTSLLDHLTHPQPNVDYNTPRYRVTLSSVGRRLMALVRVGPYLPRHPFEGPVGGAKPLLPPALTLPQGSGPRVYPLKMPDGTPPLRAKPWLPSPHSVKPPVAPTLPLPTTEQPALPKLPSPMARPPARGSM